MTKELQRLAVEKLTGEPRVIQPENDENNIGHAILNGISLSVLPDTDDRKIFFRNGIKKHLRTGETEHKRWIVAEMDGVRVYVDGDHIIVTKRDLYP